MGRTQAIKYYQQKTAGPRERPLSRNGTPTSRTIHFDLHAAEAITHRLKIGALLRAARKLVRVLTAFEHAITVIEISVKSWLMTNRWPGWAPAMAKA
jgi:hypothetical protein